MKLLSLIKTSLNETYTEVYTSKNLSDAFPMQNGVKQGDDLLPLFFKKIMNDWNWMEYISSSSMQTMLTYWVKI
jgi:hypothetical protein